MLDRLMGRTSDPALKARTPPGQYLTEKFPVLHYGSVPRTDLATWDFRVYGLVDSPLTLSWDEFKALPRKQLTTDIHCVTRWSKLDTVWEGVPIRRSSRWRSSGQRRGSSSSTPSRATPPTCRSPSSTMTTSSSRTRTTVGRSSPITAIRSASCCRSATSGRAPSGSRGLEFLDHDVPGFWERYGYHNNADFTKEERFSE